MRHVLRRAPRPVGLGAFQHHRTLREPDSESVRLNRDMFHSEALFDLDAGPATITLPHAGTRFRSPIVISQDDYVPLVAYDAGCCTLTRAMIGTRCAFAAVHTFVDPPRPPAP